VQLPAWGIEMAATTVTLIAETELFQDAIADVQRVFEALATRHGPQFRALERRIEDVIEERRPLSAPKFHHIGDGHYVIAPPVEIMAIIRDAKKTGVI